MRSPVDFFTSTSSSRRNARATPRAVTGWRPMRASGRAASAPRAALNAGTNDGMRRGLVTFERLPADEGRAPHEDVPGQRPPGSNPVDESGLLEELHRRRHHARRLERIVGVGKTADVRQLDERGLAGGLVPSRDAGVRRAESRAPMRS